jgi:cyclomaltodextrinase / maltogenic alpha-amylase / neopullulanase
MNKILVHLLMVFLVASLSSCAVLGMSGADNAESKSSAGAKGAPVVFSYEDAAATSVNIAGDFNSWNTQSDPLTREGNTWKIALKLEPGTYMYKFVINGSDWKTDPNNPDTADDGYGGENSLIKVDGSKAPAVTESQEKFQQTGYEGDIPVTFNYQPLTGGKKKVFLAGDFNNWSASATPMVEKDGIYNATLNLKIGKYAYKFVVDGNWISDENADEFVGDGYGGQNSIIFVGDKKDIDALRMVVFKYKPAGTIKEVYLAGSMNDWNQKADKMSDADGDGVFEITKLLRSGDYSYKFVVDGMNWITDNSAENFEDDGFGGRNSIITIDESYPAVVINRGDGEFLQYGLPYGQSIEIINPLNSKLIEFKARTHINDLEDVLLMIDDQAFDMQMLSYDNSYEYYRYNYELLPEQNEFDYAFIYRDGEETWYMTHNGFSKEKYVFYYSPDVIEPFFTPDWVKDGIVYQIFPERFANGDKSNDPDFSEWYYEGVKEPPERGKLLPKYTPYYHLIEDWYDVEGLTKSPYHAPDQDGYQPEYNSFYGGDISGIHQNLKYLIELGVTIIYFNPLFQAKSNHKYDAADYMKIDPHFGTNAEFKDFVADCHKNGIRVILDVAFNHTGETFWAFQDIAENCEASPYWDWYEWKKCPLPESGNYNPSDYYECWWGFGEMPNLNFDLKLANPEENSIKDISQAQPNWDVVNYVLDVAEFWISEMDLDGFRLDVPNEVPFWFWKLFREKVKSLKPDAWLVGEIWSNAIDWVNNDYFDSVMNYAYFKDPVQRFFNMRQSSAQTFDRDLKPGRLNYPTQSAQTMMNLIDSHDTFRYLETAGGDISTLRMAALFQMTYVGAPHIWYGDEIAMMGKHDPDCRRPFYWKFRSEPERVNLLNYYRRLIQIRKDNIALRRGNFRTLLTDGMTYAFAREFEDEKVIVVINNDSRENLIEIQTDIGMRSLIDQISGDNFQINNGVITIEAMPYTGYILK